ncbi:dephospho-CoA kinase [Gloeomargarita lithophora Alchichica-D10]|uniref:Dephospho-CoA kinase n=1 Tax=Gloeomargarita lithophora Alchichica-D10 TaxID=1188229 RepID=A0A1J0AFP2_9CYAN|nr:dephospho-CoA kinase [Gloeomargarita lithophora]APB34736.1 dephospho-CoA kinase [Gloeomargarita lithophora Alchichica-D10]
MIIGLTGGIATGKSTVTNYLQDKYKLTVYDADIYARNAVTPGQPAFDTICQRYGAPVLTPDGQLNRAWLGERVFSDSSERRWLEALIHPWVRQQYAQIYQQFATSDAPVVLSIPLLFEAQMTDLVQQVWVVWCTTGQQYQRLMARNACTPTPAQARITAQLPLALKMLWADQRLDNSGTLAHLYQQIERCLMPHLKK